VQALGGAKNHILVMDDADLELSAPHVISSAFGNAGQRCLAGSVAVGVGKIGDALVRELAKDASQLKIGPGTDPKVTLGPVIRGERKKKLIEYIDGAQSEGAQLVSDGRHVDREDGFFLGPTIFDRVTPEMKVWKDELFGPVLSVVRASDIDEALNVLNRSTYGNMASIFTRSGKYAREFKRRAQAGMLGVNIGVAAPMAFFPFTGWKNSFFGDLHATGQDSVRFYTRHKVVTTRWL
jgi:malonate-semialdehyde dehydrogenase (acetylating)/methylmalonate-semialdehyde dehydrogenase